MPDARRWFSVRGAGWGIALGGSLCLLMLLTSPGEVCAQTLSVSIERPAENAEVGLSELVEVGSKSV